MVGGIHGKKVIAGIVVAILIGVGTWLSNQGNTLTQTTTGGTVINQQSESHTVKIGITAKEFADELNTCQNSTATS